MYVFLFMPLRVELSAVEDEDRNRSEVRRVLDLCSKLMLYSFERFRGGAKVCYRKQTSHKNEMQAWTKDLVHILASIKPGSHLS